MNIRLTDDRGRLALALSGRLDTATTPQAAADIERLLCAHPDATALTIDATALSYLSSSGLRLILSLARRYSSFRVTEVGPEVYDVLQTTGFTKIMTVEKALRRISIEGCEEIGRGGVGTVYRLDGDTIIKGFSEGTTIDEVRHEIDMAKEAFIMGMPTAISFDVVIVGRQYGLVYELLKAEILSTHVCREPERIDEYARMFASLLHHLHSIEVPAGSNIPDALSHDRDHVRRLSRYFDGPDVDMMLNILDAIPPGNRLLHLDLQTKNVMMKDNELMLIDMGEMGYGHPAIDLGHTYSAMILSIGDYDRIIGMPRTLGNEMWRRTVNYYFEGEDQATIAHRQRQIEAIGCIRNFSWLSLSDSFPQAVVDECKAMFDERIRRRYDYLMDVCSTLGDWQV